MGRCTSFCITGRLSRYIMQSSFGPCILHFCPPGVGRLSGSIGLGFPTIGGRRLVS